MENNTNFLFEPFPYIVKSGSEKFQTGQEEVHHEGDGGIDHEVKVQMDSFKKTFLTICELYYWQVKTINLHWPNCLIGPPRRSPNQFDPV